MNSSSVIPQSVREEIEKSAASHWDNYSAGFTEDAYRIALLAMREAALHCMNISEDAQSQIDATLIIRRYAESLKP